MKYITILLVVFILAANCIGQKIPDSLSASKEYWDNKTIIGGTLSENRYITMPTPKQDTVRVLMLVCDTSDKPGIMLVDKKTGIVSMMKGNEIWWQFGYEVIEWTNNMLWNYNVEIRYTESGFPYILKEYLDEKKQPLKKGLVVWISKEIK